MIRSIHCPSTGERRKDLSPPEIRAVAESGDGLLWVSLEDAADAEVVGILQAGFHFHPLTVADCINEFYQAPKIDIFDDYLFIITHVVNPPAADEDGPLRTAEFNLYLGANYVVTVASGAAVQAVRGLWERMAIDDRHVERGADYLAYMVLDAQVQAFLPVLEDLDRQADEVSDLAISDPTPQLLRRIQGLKHGILHLRRIIAPQREVMNRLSRDDLPQISERHRIYFRDLYDHVVRVQDLSESLREMIIDNLDTYLTTMANRTNEIMKALALVSTIFLPLTFVAGVYGMNFEHMPELKWPLGYYMTWGVFALIVVAMILLFRRRRWL